MSCLKFSNFTEIITGSNRIRYYELVEKVSGISWMNCKVDRLNCASLDFPNITFNVFKGDKAFHARWLNKIKKREQIITNAIRFGDEDIKNIKRCKGFIPGYKTIIT